MLEDCGAENRGRATNRYPGCTCPPERYNPRQPKTTDPDCPEHGLYFCTAT